MNIAICDDDKQICSQIESILERYRTKTGVMLEVEVFFSGESLLNHMEQHGSFDLIYLDIELDGMNGVEVGRRIRTERKDYRTEIVYVSGKNSYDRQLFDVQPLHFIPKPIEAKTVISDIELALLRLNKGEEYFIYKRGNEKIKVPVNDIIYFESLGREVRVVRNGGMDYFYGSMKSVSAEIKKMQFIRIHRSYLVNPSYVISYKYHELTMSNGDVLPIGQARRKEIREMQMKEEFI